MSRSGYDCRAGNVCHIHLKPRLLFRQTDIPFEFPSVLRVFVADDLNFIYLINILWVFTNCIQIQGMSLSPYCTTRLVFTQGLIFLWYFWVFFAFLLLPSGTLGFSLKATTKHRLSVHIADHGVTPLTVVFNSCIYFQFLQQTVRKLGLVASVQQTFENHFPFLALV